MRGSTWERKRGTTPGAKGKRYLKDVSKMETGNCHLVLVSKKRSELSKPKRKELIATVMNF